MSLMLIRRGIEALVGTALVVVAMVGVLPAVAEAQSIATSQEAQDAADANPAAAARVVVVEPGDSLWSISAERLGGGSTPQQIAKGVERIYALNRDQIGPDPNLIFPGQRLSVPAVGSREVAHADAKATAPPAAREDTATAAATGPKKTGDAVSATESETIQASRPAPRTPEAGLAAKPEKVPAPVSKTPSRPNAPEAVAAVPAVRHAASEDSQTTNGSPLTPLLKDTRSVVVSAASELGETVTEVRAAAASDRRTLGWTILALTVLVGALMAWRLPMKRTTRWDAERWGIPTGNYGASSYTSHSGSPDVPAAKPVESGESPREPLTPAAHHSEALLREDLQEHLHHQESPAAGVAPVALEPRTNGSKANGAGTEAPPNGGVQVALAAIVAVLAAVGLWPARWGEK